MAKFNDKTPTNHEGAECPYCGVVQCDMWESIPHDGDSEIIDCECGKKFQVTTSISVDYNSRPLTCESHVFDDDWGRWFKIKLDSHRYDPTKPLLHQRYRSCVNCDDETEWEYKEIEPCTSESHEWGDWSPWHVLKTIFLPGDVTPLIVPKINEVHRFKHCQVHACNDHAGKVESKIVSHLEYLKIKTEVDGE